MPEKSKDKKRKDKRKVKQKQKQTQKQTVSQKVVVNIGDKVIAKKRKTTTRQRQTSKPSNEYAFLVNSQNSFQTAMANQLNMLEQSRERATQMRDATQGVEREQFRQELLNINRRMTDAFGQLNEQGIDVTAMLQRVQPAPDPFLQPMRRIPPEQAIVSRPTSPRQSGVTTAPPISGGGFPAQFGSVSTISSASTTEPSSIPTQPPSVPSRVSYVVESPPIFREPSDITAIEQQVPQPITAQELRAREAERLAGYPSGSVPTMSLPSVRQEDILFTEPALDTPPQSGLTGVAELFKTPERVIDPTIEGGGFAEGGKNIQGITRADKAFKAFIKKNLDAELITKPKATRRINAFRELLAANENKKAREKKLPKQILREEIDRLNKELRLDFPSVKTEELVELGAEGAKEARKEKPKKKPKKK